MNTLIQRIARDLREALAHPLTSDEAYLAQSTDVMDLERRMRALERDAGL